MEKIRNFLMENGYELYNYENDNVIEGHDDFLQIMIMKNENEEFGFKSKYILRIAILEYFDRWANSGGQWIYYTEDGVLNHLKNHSWCVTEAIQEYIRDIVELCEDRGYKNTLQNFIENLDCLVSSFYM